MEPADDTTMLIENFLPPNPVAEDEPSDKAVPLTPEQRRKASRKMRNLHAHFYQHQRDVRSPKKGNGARSARRCENLNYLLSLVDCDQEEGDQADFTELVEPSLSAFAELLREKEKMKIWNNFINCTEEEQQAILENSSPAREPSGEHLSTKSDGHVEKQDVEDNEKPQLVEHQDSSDSWEFVEDDKRTVHPSYSAETCFKRINQKMRTFLRRRHLPWGTLEQLEQEITNFFMEWPNSVYISQLHSSFDRMLLHILCQYLDLASKSFDDKSGKRHTQVENKQESFSPPAESLTHYLEQKHAHH